MNTAPLIKAYNHPSIFISIIEAKEVIETLEATIKNKTKHYGFCFNLQQIQDEIHYYKFAIFQARAQQTYQKDTESIYGYSLRPRTPSISDSDEEDDDYNNIFQHHKEEEIQNAVKKYEELVKQAEKDYDFDSYEEKQFHPSETEDYESDEQVPPSSLVEPSTKMNELDKKINGVENVVYQLLGGLFNHETQFRIIDCHKAVLNGIEPSSSIGNQSIYPTTRQGDVNEEEIKLLKQQVSKLEGTVNVLIQLLSEKINK